MKRLILIIAALMVSVGLSAQEKSGSDSLKTAVNKAVDATKTAAATAISAGADVLDNLGTKGSEEQIAQRKGSKVKLDSVILSADQQKLFLSNINGVDYNDAWSSYAKNAKTGKTLIIAGGTVAAAGGVVFAVGLATGLVGAIISPADDAQMAKHGFGVSGIGACIAGAGVITAGVGIPILVSANRKMSAICDEYNSAGERVEKEVILGSTGNGIGIAFRF